MQLNNRERSVHDSRFCGLWHYRHNRWAQFATSRRNGRRSFVRLMIYEQTARSHSSVLLDELYFRCFILKIWEIMYRYSYNDTRVIHALATFLHSYINFFFPTRVCNCITNIIFIFNFIFILNSHLEMRIIKSYKYKIIVKYIYKSLFNYIEIYFCSIFQLILYNVYRW